MDADFSTETFCCEMNFLSMEILESNNPPQISIVMLDKSTYCRAYLIILNSSFSVTKYQIIISHPRFDISQTGNKLLQLIKKSLALKETKLCIIIITIIVNVIDYNSV